jgi:hypothetical protein
MLEGQKSLLRVIDILRISRLETEGVTAEGTGGEEKVRAAASG